MINELSKISNEVAKESGLWEEYNNAKTLLLLNPEIDHSIVHNAVMQRLAQVISDLMRANESLKRDSFPNFQDNIVNALISLLDISYELDIDLEQNIFEILDIEFTNDKRDSRLSSLLPFNSFLKR